MPQEDAKLTLAVDDDGFVCLVAPDDYAGFVAEDWELDDVLARFVEQMNRGTLFVAYPGPDHAGSDLVVTASSGTEPVLREISGVVRVGSQGLWLTDYTQLTMAAQFADSAPIAPYSIHLTMAPGDYLVTLRESAHPESPFQLVLMPVDPSAVVQHDAVPWFE